MHNQPLLWTGRVASVYNFVPWPAARRVPATERHSLCGGSSLVTFDEMLPELIELVRPQGARPDTPLEAETFFKKLVAPFGDRESCQHHLAKVVPGMFRCLADRPEWIQDPSWLWFEGEPMVFVGSIEAPKGTFHDNARFYVFWSPKIGVTKCIIQVS